MLDPPIKLTVGQQLAWAAALSYFGIFFAVPLRRQVYRDRPPRQMRACVCVGG